jgi:glycine/D-amino acid oxidase-like deaminating enzyme
MAMLHTPYGLWGDEAGHVAPRPPLRGEHHADVVVIGGGYLGMWTAWQLAEQAPDIRVAILDAHVCGRGPSGRNGGFATAWWDELHELRDRFGDAEALALAHASSDAVAALGAWCEQQQVDAWFRASGELHVSSAPAQDDAWLPAVRACAELGEADRFVALSAEEIRARCASPVLRGGALLRDGATVQPARLGQGLRARLLERGVAIHEHSRVRRLTVTPGSVIAECDHGRVHAGHAVLSVNASAAGIGPLRNRLTVASSHVVATEPVPDVLEELGWTGGEAIADARTFLHYTRTTRDGRIVFGWAGGLIACGGRVGGRAEVDRTVVAQTRRDLERFFPGVRGRDVTHAWGGPIDVSPTHLPFFGSLSGDRVHYGVGFTGNGVAPTWLGGRILAALALDRRDDVTRLAIVEPPPIRTPPEPARWLGGSIIRAAYLRRERAEDAGSETDAVTRWITQIPRRLGVHIGR